MRFAVQKRKKAICRVIPGNLLVAGFSSSLVLALAIEASIPASALSNALIALGRANWCRIGRWTVIKATSGRIVFQSGRATVRKGASYGGPSSFMASLFFIFCIDAYMDL